jgi:hypothetical protein
MPDKEKVAPKKGASKKEPKKPPRRKPKKSVDESVTEQTGVETLVEPEEVTEVSVVPSDDQVNAQVSLIDSTSRIPITSWTEPDFVSCGDEFIDEAVRFINEKANEAVYTSSIEMGAYILSHFFGDDVQLATSRNPRKSVSYSKLCHHPELAVKPETLGVMVRVAAQEKFFADEDVNTEGLTYSHKAQLVKFVNDDKKIKLVEEILEQTWSVRQLKTELYHLRDKRIAESPQSEVRLIGDYVSHIVYSRPKFFYDRGENLFQDQSKRKELLKSLRGKTRRDLLERVDDAVEAAEEWLRLCEEVRHDLEEIEDETEQEKNKK